MACAVDHSDVQLIMEGLPVDQGRKGRHKCAACAYNLGLSAGFRLDEQINLSNLLNSLEENQAQAQRHKSPHAAYAQGYLEGVRQYYLQK